MFVEISSLPFASWWALLNILGVLFGVFYVLLHPREPRSMLAWILTFLFVPIFGVVLFFLLSEPKRNRARRRLTRKRRGMNPELGKTVGAFRRIHAPVIEENGFPPSLRKFVKLATRINDRQPPTGANTVEIYHDRGPDAWQALLESVASASHHVHLEYFIFRADRSGEELARLLMKKAKNGVSCRLLLDHLGSWDLPLSFVDRLRSSGVQVAWFMPVLPWRGPRWRFHFNFRNHRKIVVIDGQVAFTGSQNIADEYFRSDTPSGLWIDTHLRLTGPAVYELQETFIEDWYYATGDDIFAEHYFPSLQEQEHSHGQIVQVIPSGPDSDAGIMHHLLLAAISAADYSVVLATPYFVPDQAMVLTLEAAALRGVRVRLLLPEKSDHGLALWAGRSYYQELTESGVEISEMGPAFLHSKVGVIDQLWGLVGSANMDQRSFHLNFEITTVLYESSSLLQLEHCLVDLIDHSQRSTAPFCGLWQRLKMGVARLVSPLY
ncbi:MAG: cardiolipin synthase [Proteobacteria bacterium]|nr:cardiolipin synthase [Pseudomonadota bacterium]MBU1058574.1 cardiolipin synthase [Pseudomonadota bacterium]